MYIVCFYIYVTQLYCDFIGLETEHLSFVYRLEHIHTYRIKLKARQGKVLLNVKRKKPHRGDALRQHFRGSHDTGEGNEGRA